MVFAVYSTDPAPKTNALMALFRSGYPFSFCVLKRFQIYNVRFQTRINEESTRDASFIQSAGPAVILKIHKTVWRHDASASVRTVGPYTAR